MSMSKDRVKFTIPAHRLTSSTQACSYRKVCLEAFGTDFSDQRTGTCWEINVICRPSQFARFLIARNREGIQNQFSELNPVLFTPKTSGNVEVDVSGKPAHC